MIFDNNNKQILSFLSNRNIKHNKFRNFICVCAIILTTILFTSLFTIMGGIYKSAQKSTMFEQGNKSNLTIENITEIQFLNIEKNPVVKCAGREKDIGNIQIKKNINNIIYCDANYAKLNFLYPQKGCMPLEENDIVISQNILEKMELKSEINQKININMLIDGKEYLRKFNVCGIYVNNYNFAQDSIIVSKNFLEKNKDDINNLSRVDIEFDNSFWLDKKISKLYKECKIDSDVKEKINWSYDYVLYKGIFYQHILLIFFISIIGYSIMYNTLGISISSDRDFYLFLKILGATKEQIKKIINKQFILLSFIGVPVGVIFGYIIGNLVLPMINVVMLDNILSYKETSISFNPIIFILAGILSVIIIFSSSRSSIEKVQNINISEDIYYDNSNINNRKLNHNFNIYRMSILEFMQEKKKRMLVIFSLSISLVLFNALFNVIADFNIDDYINQSVVTIEEMQENQSDIINYSYNDKEYTHFLLKYTKIKKSYIVVGGVIVFLVGLIGILNYINFQTNRIMSSKSELMLLESIGMTKKQIMKLLIYESIFYFLSSIFLEIIEVIIIRKLLFQRINNYFIFMPMLISSPLLLFICCIIPIVIYIQISNENVYDRMIKL